MSKRLFLLKGGEELSWLGDKLHVMGAVLLGFWPINLMIGVVASAFQAEALLVLLIVFLVIVDTITKMVALCVQHVANLGDKTAAEVKRKEILFGLFGAFHTGAISSRGLIVGFTRKIGLYCFLGYVALLAESMPPKEIFGLEVLNELADIIFMVIILTELLSVLENFRDMGSKGIDKIQSGVFWLADQFTNGKFSATINYSMKREEDNHEGS